ncbi:hypothetical protein DVH24_021162 [Malus domestica]|uniref:Uncharacterized protein n=1 Tax=Malus domestica TaxID=3750 RepID=A0A498J8M9_MALDO|nr:hypothetical protein DVH24_021162 [Malus domestica]
MRKSFKKANIYNQIPHQEIRPIQRLWVLNTRFKSVRLRCKPCWKQPYLIAKIHPNSRANIKNSTTEFKRTLNKYQHHTVPTVAL